MSKFSRLMGAVFLIGTIAVLIMCGCDLKYPDPKSQMSEYLLSLYPPPDYTVVGMTCMGFDSDGDGYVSCTATMKDSRGTMKREVALCSKWGYGCKPAPFVQ